VVQVTDEIRAAIEHSGPIPFERFMDLALYGEQGFYMRQQGGAAGRRGDFITGPEVGPLFGAVIAGYFDAQWDKLGRPDPFTVVDVGAGPGTLGRAVMAARPGCADALHYVAVEVSAEQRRHHPEGVESRPDLPAGPIDGVVIANELLDNVPFRLAVYDSGWREAFVDLGRDGLFTEVLSTPFAEVPRCLPSVSTFGARAPLIDRAARMVDRFVALADEVLLIDYGVRSTAELAARPWREWMRTYRSHERGGHYLRVPGEQDITVDVPFDQLPPPDAMQSQADFLSQWGIGQLVAEGVRVWTEQAARPGLEAMRMRSRVSESEALLDPAGLGSFHVLEFASRRGHRPAPTIAR
jgi:SAM-dependent MidA family methyltransferase